MVVANVVSEFQIDGRAGRRAGKGRCLRGGHRRKGPDSGKCKRIWDSPCTFSNLHITMVTRRRFSECRLS